MDRILFRRNEYVGQQPPIPLLCDVSFNTREASSRGVPMFANPYYLYISQAEALAFI
jgi:hypothetical protein